MTDEENMLVKLAREDERQEISKELDRMFASVTRDNICDQGVGFRQAIRQVRKFLNERGDQVMKGYLGEFTLTTLEDTPFEDFDQGDWALEFISLHGQTDGSHHKAWALDQVARILLGTPVKVEVASWSNGFQEFRVSTGEPSEEYLCWVEEQKGAVDPIHGGTEHDWDVGVAP